MPSSAALSLPPFFLPFLSALSSGCGFSRLLRRDVQEHQATGKLVAVLGEHHAVVGVEQAIGGSGRLTERFMACGARRLGAEAGEAVPEQVDVVVVVEQIIDHVVAERAVQAAMKLIRAQRALHGHELLDRCEVDTRLLAGAARGDLDGLLHELARGVDVLRHVLHACVDVFAIANSKVVLRALVRRVADAEAGRQAEQNAGRRNRDRAATRLAADLVFFDRRVIDDQRHAAVADGLRGRCGEGVDARCAGLRGKPCRGAPKHAVPVPAEPGRPMGSEHSGWERARRVRTVRRLERGVHLATMGHLRCPLEHLESRLRLPEVEPNQACPEMRPGAPA